MNNPRPVRSQLLVPGMSRRRFLRVTGAGFTALVGVRVLAACGGDDDDTAATTATSDVDAESTPSTSVPATTASGPVTETDVAVALGWINNVEFAGLWVADDAGFYDEGGIVPEFLQGGPNAPSPVVSVAAGDANIGVIPSQTSLCDAINEGNDFVIFGTQFQVSPGAVLSLIGHPVETPEDLLGITFLGQDGVDITIDAVLDIAGLEHDYEFVPVGFTPDPLLEGQGEAYSCFATNQPIYLEQQGMVEGTDFVVTPWADLGLPAYANLFFSERTWFEANRDAVVNFMTASVKGFELNSQDASLAATLAVDKYGADLGLDLEQQIRENELQLPLMEGPLTEAEGLLRLDPQQWDGPMADAYVASGRDAMPPSEVVFDLTVLDDVFGDQTTLLEA